MALLEFIFGGVATLAVRVAPKIVVNAIAVIRQELRELFPELSRSYKQARQTVDVKAEELSEIDLELFKREESFRRYGNPSDSNAIEQLEIQKQEKYKEYQVAQGESAQKEVEENPGKFDESQLQEGCENKLLYHTGLITLAKTCPTCDRSMRLQHRTMENPKFTDFFWQCTGYYAGSRCKSISFRASDINLFHRNDIQEIEIGNSDLIAIASEQETQREIDVRLRGHLGKVDVDIFCPVHLTPMELRRKHGSSDLPLLDKYHLRCKNPTCSQTTKLKSYPQLASYLKRKEGKGILD